MATQVIKTHNRNYNYNPQGSAAATATMAADNPFERGVQLQTRSMMPGMGYLGAEGDTGGAQDKQEPSEWIKTLQTGLTQIGLKWAADEVLETPKSQTMSAPAAQQLPARQPTNLTAPQPSAVPPANTIGYPVNAMAVPQRGGFMKALPWVIGGVAVLGLGGIVLLGRKKK